MSRARGITIVVAALSLALACSNYGSDDEASPAPDRDASVDDADATSAIDGALDGGSDAIPGWSPTALPGLVVWLDGANGLEIKAGSDDVSQWTDRSGMGNHARAGNLAPKRTTLPNGAPAVKFVGGDRLAITDSVSLRLGTAPFLIEVVANNHTPLTGRIWNYGMLYVKQSSISPYVGAAMSANHVVDNDKDAATSQLQGQLDGNAMFLLSDAGYRDRVFLLGLERSSGGATTTIDLRLDGVIAASDQSAKYEVDVSAVGQVAYIGGSSIGQDLVGEIAEIVVVAGAVSVTDLMKLETYLKSKYGL